MADVFDQVQAEQKNGGDVFDQVHAEKQAAVPKLQTSEKSVGGFLSNLVSSGAQMAGNVANAVAHPINTLDALGAIPVGTFEKATGVQVGDGSSAKMLDSMLDHFKQRYGGIDQAKEALYKDPVGVMADLSTVAGMGGGVLRGAAEVADAANAARVASIAGKAADVAGTVASVADPVQLAAKGGAAALRAAKPAQLAERVYQSALKPGPGSYSLDQVKRMVGTGIDNAIPVSEGGAQKIHDLVMDLNQKISDRINAGANSGVTIDPNKVAQRLDQVRQKFGNQVNPTADLNTIDKAQTDFLGGPGAGPMPADMAQSVKQGTYAQLKGRAYGELKTAEIESQKALARGIKEELANAIPEIGSLNEQESKLLGLAPALERAVRRIDNHDMLGIGTPIAAGAAHAMTGSGAAAVAAGVLKSLLDNPGIKSRLAIAINRAQQLHPEWYGRPSMATAISRVDEYLNNLSTPVQTPQTSAANTTQP